MSGASKIIKNRIKSVRTTHNIARAMELVAAAKIKKATNSLLASRTYARHAQELLASLARESKLRHPLLLQTKSSKELLIVVASNKGLCGSYNTNIVKAAVQYIKNNKDKEIDIIAVGRKAEAISKWSKGKVIASFVKFPDDVRPDDITALPKMVIGDFTKKIYGKVSIAFTDFVSSLKYDAKVSSLLPITKENLAEVSGIKNIPKRPTASILFEPGEEEVLNLILPRLTEVRIYQSLLEANASEHSARMIAMRNATDSAKTMVEELSLYYNQARQAAITQEIAEISSGTEALTDAR